MTDATPSRNRPAAALTATAVVVMAGAAALAVALLLGFGPATAPSSTLPAAAAAHDHEAEHDPEAGAITGAADAPEADDAHEHDAEALPVPTATPAEPSAAERLIAETKASIGRWADVEDAIADGYRSIGDAFTGHEHYTHWEWRQDGTILDPTRPESLVYEVGPEGGRTLVSAMYLLPPGSTMDDVPDLGDPRAVWHDHDNLCWSPDGRLAGILVDGRCVPGGELIVSPPMIHVWIVDHPCGPFAGLGTHGDGCEHDH